jgi:GTPase
VLAEDKLFATLDTRSRHLKVGWAGYGDREIVITDTVGFIRNLPKDLFAAFRATFEEAADADIIVHVVDASDRAKDDHMRTTEALLEELGLADIPRILVFNKADLLDPGEGAALLRRHRNDGAPVLLAATNRETTRTLIERIAQLLAVRWEESAKVPPVAREEVGCEADEVAEDTGASTLDELLRRSGRRARPRARA